MADKPAAGKLTGADLDRLGKVISEAIKPEQKPASKTDLDQINEIIKNARATWFALLSALVFAAVTLASVKDIGFFIPSVQTKLPLAGISVPIRSFFWAGSLLISALYIYFHLYLEQLWTALGEADARIGDKPLADCIHPWLVSDTALRVRDWLRTDKGFFRYLSQELRCTWRKIWNKDLRWIKSWKIKHRSARNRSMGWVSNATTVALVWLFGLAIIFWFWWRSMPAHDLFLTSWLGLILIATLYVFFKSAYEALARLKGRPIRERWKLGFPILVIVVVGLTVLRTEIDLWAGEKREPAITIYECDFVKEGFERKYCPENFKITKDIFRPASAKLREIVFTKKPKGWLGKEVAQTEFRTSWCKLMEPVKCNINPLDPSTNKFSPSMEDTFQKAWNVRWEAIVGSFDKPDLRDSRLEGADFEGAFLESANLRDAFLDDANLIEANLEGAFLEGAYLKRALLTGAKLKGANLTDANLEGARIVGTSVQSIDLQSTIFESTNFSGSLLRFVDFTKIDMEQLEGFRSSFGDGSVKLPKDYSAPRHWCKSVLSDEEFFGRWRERLGKDAELTMTKEELKKYPAISPDTPCPDPK